MMVSLKSPFHALVFSFILIIALDLSISLDVMSLIDGTCAESVFVTFLATLVQITPLRLRFLTR